MFSLFLSVKWVVTVIRLTFFKSCLIGFCLKDTEVYLRLNSNCHLKQINSFPLDMLILISVQGTFIPAQ